MPKSTASENEVASALKWYASGVLEGRSPASVAADVVAHGRPVRGVAFRTPAMLAAGLAFVLVLGVAAVQLVGQTGSRPATAEVGGLTYGVAVARSLRLTEANLRVYGELSRLDSGLQIQGSDVYVIEGVSPEDALVVRLEPGARDDAGPLGDYALLVRGSYAPLCEFFDPTSDATPAECR